MADVTIALCFHLIGVVWWIGGLAFVSTVLLPATRRDPERALQRFQAMERRFAPQVRVALLLVGASGGWMLYRLALWRVLDEPSFWWLHAMIVLWALFFVMLFVLKPLGVLRRVMTGAPERDVGRRLARMHRVHVVLLIFALVTVAGAVIGERGLG